MFNKLKLANQVYIPDIKAYTTKHPGYGSPGCIILFFAGCYFPLSAALLLIVPGISKAGAAPPL
jgi:hypothetical protein